MLQRCDSARAMMLATMTECEHLRKFLPAKLAQKSPDSNSFTLEIHR